MSTPKLELKLERRKRTSIYASDYGKLECDILCELNEVEHTNPMLWNNTLRLEAGKAIEEQMVKILKFNGIVDEAYNQDTAPTTSITREGAEIRMKFDALSKKSTLKLDGTVLPNTESIEIGEGEPIEIKSINNKNAFDIRDYMEGNPRENYVGQLSIYMEALGKEQGHLFVASVDGLHTFWFVCKKIDEGKYQCGNVIVDVNKEYKRFGEIWKKFINKQEPNWSQEIYKLPISEIDFTQLSTNAISEARNNRKVIGSKDSFKILYSNFANLIIEKQGSIRGYSESELAEIIAKTKGYSAKPKKEKTLQTGVKKS